MDMLPWAVRVDYVLVFGYESHLKPEDQVYS
jgi:hypothetical protein